MPNIASIPKSILAVDVAKIPAVYVPDYSTIVARQNAGMVYLIFDYTKAVELTTLIAHKIGYSIAMAKLAPDEMIVLVINGERVELLWGIAQKVSTALLRKADAADDWQIQQRRKVT